MPCPYPQISSGSIKFPNQLEKIILIVYKLGGKRRQLCVLLPMGKLLKCKPAIPCEFMPGRPGLYSQLKIVVDISASK